MQCKKWELQYIQNLDAMIPCLCQCSPGPHLLHIKAGACSGELCGPSCLQPTVQKDFFSTEWSSASYFTLGRTMKWRNCHGEVWHLFGSSTKSNCGIECWTKLFLAWMTALPKLPVPYLHAGTSKDLTVSNPSFQDCRLFILLPP